jgi:hypothetical protein
MSNPVRLIIFGLLRGTRAEDLAGLLGDCGAPGLQMVDLPGDSGQAFAVVHLAPDRSLATRLARRIGTRQFQGHPLQCWVTALPWL